MQKAKESAANVTASAKAGLDKTKVVVQEKVERVTAKDPMQKEMATEKKHDKINEAEWNKQQAREHNAATARTATTGGGYTATGTGLGHTAGTGTHGAGVGHTTGTGYGTGTSGGVTDKIKAAMPGHTGTCTQATGVEHTGTGYGTGTGHTTGYGTGTYDTGVGIPPERCTQQAVEE